MLGTLKGELSLALALDALKTQHNLLGGLSLLVEDRPGLTTVTSLLTVVSSLTLGIERCLTSLVLGHLVLGVTAAVLTFAIGTASLRNVHHSCCTSVSDFVTMFNTSRAGTGAWDWVRTEWKSFESRVVIRIYMYYVKALLNYVIDYNVTVRVNSSHRGCLAK